MYHIGLFASDEIMKNYVEFICSQISSDCGSSVRQTSGFPMKGANVPVKLKILNKLTRSAEMEITSLGFSKTFIFFMSRHKSPHKLLHELQEKIDELVSEIIDENALNRDDIHKEHIFPGHWKKFNIIQK